MTPTTRGSVPGLMEARVWPPRITAVVEKPSLESMGKPNSENVYVWVCGKAGYREAVRGVSDQKTQIKNISEASGFENWD